MKFPTQARKLFLKAHPDVRLSVPVPIFITPESGAHLFSGGKVVIDAGAYEWTFKSPIKTIQR